MIRISKLIKMLNGENDTFYVKPKRKAGLTIDTIKLIALIAMICDHIGFVLIDKGKLYGYDIYLYSYVITLKDAAPWILLKNILRTVGRISFPLFAFCLSEGFSHTSNAYKYGARLAIFALISEIPFDLACFNTPVDFSTQNIFFTLLLGFMGMFIINKIDDEVWILKLFAFIGACFAGHLIRCDYGWKGVALIMACNIVRNSKLLETAVVGTGGVMLSLTRAGFGGVAAIITWFYNGRKGERSLKYLYYIIYPLHLLLFYAIVYMSTLLTAER